jgi:hypothetical protein
MTKRFPAIIVIVNIILGLALFLSSQSVLLTLSGKPPVIVEGVDVFSIYVAYAQVGSSPVPAIAWSIPNFPFFIFIVLLAVNAVLIIALSREKETKQNPNQNSPPS